MSREQYFRMAVCAACAVACAGIIWFVYGPNGSGANSVLPDPPSQWVSH